MDAKKEGELRARFDKFGEELPPEVILSGAGVYGEDVVLQKQYINGVSVYLALMDVPLWGGDVEVPDYNLNLKENWARFCQFFRNLWRRIKE